MKRLLLWSGFCFCLCCCCKWACGNWGLICIVYINVNMQSTSLHSIWLAKQFCKSAIKLWPLICYCCCCLLLLLLILLLILIFQIVMKYNIKYTNTMTNEYTKHKVVEKKRRKSSNLDQWISKDVLNTKKKINSNNRKRQNCSELILVIQKKKVIKLTTQT